MQHVIPIENRIMINVNVGVKIIVRAEKNFSWNPSTYIYQNGKYLKTSADISVIVFNEIINATDSLSTNASTDFHNFQESKISVLSSIQFY